MSLMSVAKYKKPNAEAYKAVRDLMEQYFDIEAPEDTEVEAIVTELRRTLRMRTVAMEYSRIIKPHT